jgi:hypothetical protein
MRENQDRARVTMFLALLALVGIAVKFLTIAALHFVRLDANPVSEPISNYGVGPYGFLFDCRSRRQRLGYSRPSIWPLSRHRTIW